MSNKSNMWMIGLVCLIMMTTVPITTTLSNSMDNYPLQQNDDIASQNQTGFMVKRDCDLLKHFSSYNQFEEYVGDNPNAYYYNGG